MWVMLAVLRFSLEVDFRLPLMYMLESRELIDCQYNHLQIVLVINPLRITCGQMISIIQWLMLPKDQLSLFRKWVMLINFNTVTMLVRQVISQCLRLIGFLICPAFLFENATNMVNKKINILRFINKSAIKTLFLHFILYPFSHVRQSNHYNS